VALNVLNGIGKPVYSGIPRYEKCITLKAEFGKIQVKVESVKTIPVTGRGGL
jgi:hypothetical protein